MNVQALKHFNECMSTHFGKMQAAIGGTSGQQQVVGEEETLTHDFLFGLLEGGAEGSQATPSAFGLVNNDL